MMQTILRDEIRTVALGYDLLYKITNDLMEEYLSPRTLNCGENIRNSAFKISSKSWLESGHKPANNDDRYVPTRSGATNRQGMRFGGAEVNKLERQVIDNSYVQTLVEGEDTTVTTPTGRVQRWDLTTIRSYRIDRSVKPGEPPQEPGLNPHIRRMGL